MVECRKDNDHVRLTNRQELPSTSPRTIKKSEIGLDGDRRDISSTIKFLHQCRFSEAKAWSKIIPVPNATETLAQLQLTPLSDRSTASLGIDRARAGENFHRWQVLHQMLQFRCTQLDDELAL
jgi:hypothetical protein